jgi:DNA-binding NarL/FixJ family response regulator
VAVRPSKGPTVGLNIADATRREDLSAQLSRLGALVVSATAYAEADIVITDRSEDRMEQPTIVLGADATRMAAADLGDLPVAFLPHAPSDEELALACDALAQGLCVMPRKLVDALIDRAFGAAQFNPGEDEPDDALLSRREREVLAILVDGGSNKEIARSLAVSVHTAKFHVASLRDKLHARGRADLVAIALRRGLVAL